MLVFIDINFIACALAESFYGDYAAAIGFSVVACLLSLFIAIRGL